MKNIITLDHVAMISHFKYERDINLAKKLEDINLLYKSLYNSVNRRNKIRRIFNV
jgi:hypothetical protein